MLTWQCKSFEEFSTLELYDVLMLRQEVFGVEQRCVYNDLDGLDQIGLHLTARASVHDPDHDGRFGLGELHAYLRILPPGQRFAEASIGRVLTRMSARGAGLGNTLMTRGIDTIEKKFPAASIRISAQYHLEQFYVRLGFEAVSAPYDEDGIPHIEMLKGCS